MTEDMLDSLIGKYQSAITCFCFMGGDIEPFEIQRLASWIKKKFPGLKTAWDSGKADLPDGFDVTVLDFIKLGPFIESLGGLKSPETNQRMYSVSSDGKMERIFLI